MTCRNYIPGPNGDCQRCGEMRAGHAGSESPLQRPTEVQVRMFCELMEWNYDDKIDREEAHGILHAVMNAESDK